MGCGRYTQPMTPYFVLLRGINVAGIKIAMADLRQTLTDAGFANVHTWLATGNVRLEARASDPATVKAQVEQRLRERFGYEAWVIVLEPAELRRMVESYPFERERSGWHPYVVFGSEPASLDALLATRGMLDESVERIAAGVAVVYWEVVQGMTTQSAFGREAAKARYRATTTTRNLRTLQKMLA